MIGPNKLQKVVITKADNGYIVRTLCSGLGMYSEPYIKPLLVFETFMGLTSYLENIMMNPTTEKADENE